MTPFSSISNLLGYLVIAEDGAVLSSAGELENDEKTSDIIYKLITMTHNLDSAVFAKNSIQKLTIVCEDCNYAVCLSNRKIFVARRKNVK